MRGATAIIPGSYPPGYFPPDSHLPKSPGARKTRLSSFWQGTQDVEDSKLLAIEATPPDHCTDGPLIAETEVPPAHFPFVASSLPPATAPVRVYEDKEDGDYFGMDDEKLFGNLSTSESDASRMLTSVTRSEHEVSRQLSAPPFGSEPSTVPALPRRICLTRQTSAPLPTLTLYERRLQNIRPSSDTSEISRASRSAKEEQMFSELGYLAPPNPPDELERRRALYRFNIWNTGHDANFDRIAHLVKLVFNTRIVTISLVDGTDEFFKSESGFGFHNMPRSTSFDAHAILQRENEPTVVLDACEDWRFSRNPLVTDHPYIRFYAGCPLRTQDGYNIGTLSIIDDNPRREFNPRQRHTLKEFAQITMRELELWRDKIQLRIRDRIQNSMEQFTRECLEVDKEVSGGNKSQGQGTITGSPNSMEYIYERAARLVKRTLDVEGAVVMNVSHVDVVENISAECSTSIAIHSHNPQSGTSHRMLNVDEFSKLQDFFSKHPEGKMCEGVLPTGLRPFLPPQIEYALAVPIFNIDKRPFAILCAYSTGERTTPFLEGHELSYLRAIGVIILSAVLKRRMILADKAKGLFISNISHELRTPLHGILASAELLSDTKLDHSQASFLQTVQACGTSLVETVNHVLDFTKLSGNSKAGGVENAVQHSRVDLMQLLEDATEGCWIGHRARMFTSEIGSVYSPPKPDKNSAASPQPTKFVETVLDVQHVDTGWIVRCEKGGIRRVFMNLFGNSLKFTSDGYVHITLRQCPLGPGKIKIELSVIDTGKVRTDDLNRNGLFHPFSQENPLQTGTGLGLAIVNSIVRSNSVDGKVDVWSAEGIGTEIKVTFNAEVITDEESQVNDAELIKVYNALQRPGISLVGFDEGHRGTQLLRTVLSNYIVSRWGFKLATGSEKGDVVIINDDLSPVTRAVEEKALNRAFIILSAARGDPRLMNAVTDYERLGGFCRIVYKPYGPQRLCASLKLCLHALNVARASRLNSSPPTDGHSSQSAQAHTDTEEVPLGSVFTRRYSEDKKVLTLRPLLGPRAFTAHPLSTWSNLGSPLERDELAESLAKDQMDSPVFSQSPSSPTIAIGTGGTLLKTSVGALQPKRAVRVLVVEDNAILRNLLVKWLKNKASGYDFCEAVDGMEGVRTFESEGTFDVVLVDLSMPVLDGVGATAKIREFELNRKHEMSAMLATPPVDTRILALTGMSSLEDKRRAFEAGVDGYLVKPVAFKTLDIIFHKLGLSS
ncbi:hypothetical protein BDY19DRAFT_893168 [Irpex rosettiformis]|uniref:Uncharacterized protein n=1 Tax=Irpex rosettiformis TaxID=378272 RepID=A0ACB8TZ73_9APHY|nr:hypothetical protein BDY19DRAFT_893168 [Irpex rosettiformis]